MADKMYLVYIGAVIIVSIIYLATEKSTKSLLNFLFNFNEVETEVYYKSAKIALEKISSWSIWLTSLQWQLWLYWRKINN